eukprot:GHVU01121229.1.p1 GENE.GHVU01121229.1~~GHVU01121229.1.p1  ORF type:complete len:193 (+),score=44.64 GHVU01121229.1:42-581(+)
MGEEPDKCHVPTMLSFIDGVLKTMPGYAEEGTDPLYQFFDRINAVYDGPDSAEIQEKAIKRSREMMKKQLKTMQDDPRINDATKETFAKATQEILEEMDQGTQPLMNEEEMGPHGKYWKARIEQDIIDAMDEAKQPLMSEEEMGPHGKSWKANIEQGIIDTMDEAKQPLMSEEEMRIEL